MIKTTFQKFLLVLNVPETKTDSVKRLPCLSFYKIYIYFIHGISYNGKNYPLQHYSMTGDGPYPKKDD